MRSLIEFVLAVILTIVVLLLIGLFLPGGGHGHVERSIIIERPASHIYDMLNSFKRFNEWSPWAKKDTTASFTFSGPERGQGARMEWSGNEKVGSGSFEIIESTPTNYIKMTQIVKEGRTGTVSYKIEPSDLGVKVVWAYDVELGANPIERIKGRYLDSSVGADFQYGLMRLKALIESSAYARDYSDIEISQQEVLAQPALKLSGLVEVYSATEFPDLDAGVADTMKTLEAFMQRNNLTATGAAQVQVTLKERYRLAYDVTLPVDRNDVPMRDEIQAVTTTGGSMLVAEHVGERRRSNQTFEKLQAYATIYGLAFDPQAKPIEEFLPDRPAPVVPEEGTDQAAADAAAPADAAAAPADAAATDGAAAEEAEPEMVQVTRVYLPLGLPAVVDPNAPVDPDAAPVDPSAAPAPAEATPAG